MPPDAASCDWRRASIADGLSASWRAALARLTIAWVAIFALTASDWMAMFDQWWNISTYNHILFIPVIVGWFAWNRRHELAKLDPEGWRPGLVLLAGALLLWLVGTLAGVNTASQLGAVLALQATFATLMGPRIFAALLFPLAYMFFLVPFGDELVPTLQMVTARMTIDLTHLSGIPAEVDGVFIDTPVGLFEVAEACSGVQFLVAMAALAALIAQSCFSSWKRRAIFLAAAMALPILANGVRAWGTIYIAQSQGVEFAAGFDHIFYGWIFFGLVIALLLAGSWRWFDRDPEDPQISAAAIRTDARLARIADRPISANRAAALVIGIALAFGLWSQAALGAAAEAPRQRIDLPSVPGWTQVDTTMAVPWQPRAAGADRRQLARYTDAGGRVVDVFLAMDVRTEAGPDLTSASEGVVPPDSDWRWLSSGPPRALAKSDHLLARGSVKRFALTSYRTGDLTTASVPLFKLSLLGDRIMLRPRPTMMLIVSAEGSEDTELVARVDDFVAATGDRGVWMDRAAGLR